MNTFKENTTALIILLVMIIAKGAVFMFLWNWFLVPLKLPAITLLHAIALKMTISFITHHTKDGDEDLIMAAFALIIGYLIHLI